MMKTRNYIKKSESREKFDYSKVVSSLKGVFSLLSMKQKILLGITFAMLFIPLTAFLVIHNGHKTIMLSDEGVIQLTNSPIAAASAKRGFITVPAGIVKANPFLPYRDIGDNQGYLDVPAFDLVEPPEVVNENSDAARVMDTTVSGILYDKYSPSAILNIEGNDYLVKKGDVVNNYKVVNIMQDSVTVKLGSNVYKAGIGEILTEGTLNHNNVSNLSSKFGGEK